MDLKLKEIGHGAVEEKFEDELLKVIDNILDVNTDAKTVRKITVELSIKPNQEDRELCAMEVSVWSKLAKTKALVSQLVVGMDRSTGEVNAVESIPTQQPLFPEKQPENSSTGKVVNMKQGGM